MPLQQASHETSEIRGEARAPADLPAEERGRRDLYALLGSLLGAPPDAARLDRLADLEGDASALGAALGGLAAAARRATAESVAREFQALFIGLGEGELVPYGSYYLTGFLHERPLARLRGDLRALGIARADGVAEPEDGIASLCEIMAALIGGAFAAPAPLAGQRGFFRAHVEPWAARFFADLAEAPSAAFYRAVAELGRVFIDIESESFSISD